MGWQNFYKTLHSLLELIVFVHKSVETCLEWIEYVAIADEYEFEVFNIFIKNLPSAADGICSE